MEPQDVRFAAVDGLRVCKFDKEAVVFAPLSWDAHLLNPAATAVLELLLEAPRCAAEVVAFLKDALQKDEQAQACAHAKRLIGELQSLGLIGVVESGSSANS